MNLKLLLQEAINLAKPATKHGRVATYIPELKKASISDLGVTLIDHKGNTYSCGDCHQKFTMQSISKVFTLILALCDHGEKQVFSAVGMEPTGDPFNSVIKLETVDPAKPLNPMINAGAIAVTAQIKGSNNQEKLSRLLHLIRNIAGNDKIEVDYAVYRSEKKTGDRNRALAYFLKDIGIISGDVEEIVDLYFRQCAINVTCEDLAKLGFFLANHGERRFAKLAIDPGIIKIALTFMVTCGMYNASGEFAIRVGIPAKSGVSGGIMAAVPNKMGIGVYSPGLDEKGNSIAGLKVLDYLASKLNLSIF